MTGALTYKDIDGLIVGTVTTVGINTGGNDVTLTTGGLLTIANDITATGKTVDINAAGVAETGGDHQERQVAIARRRGIYARRQQCGQYARRQCDGGSYLQGHGRSDRRLGNRQRNDYQWNHHGRKRCYAHGGWFAHHRE